MSKATPVAVEPTDELAALREQIATMQAQLDATPKVHRTVQGVPTTTQRTLTLSDGTVREDL